MWNKVYKQGGRNRVYSGRRNVKKQKAVLDTLRELKENIAYRTKIQCYRNGDIQWIEYFPPRHPPPPPKADMKNSVGE